MKKFILTIVVVITSLPFYGQESGKNFIDQNYIEITGNAVKQIIPNRIYLKIILNEKNFKGKPLSEIENLMITKLKEKGIDVSTNLTVKDFLSNFKNYWLLNSNIFLIKEYQLLVFDAKTTELVFTELEKLEISDISIDKLDHSEMEKFQLEIKIEAIKSAKEKANVIASAINQEIGRALYISENTNNLNMTGRLQGVAAGIMIRGMGSKNSYGSSGPTPIDDIEFEKLKLEYNITARFELK